MRERITPQDVNVNLGLGKLRDNGERHLINTSSKNSTELRLEVGKTYVNRKGEKVKIINNDRHDAYPFDGNNAHSYTVNGFWIGYNRPTGYDLVAEVHNISLEVGKTYLTRDGKNKVTIKNVLEWSQWPYLGDNGETYTKKGIYSHLFVATDKDLVEEVTLPIDAAPLYDVTQAFINQSVKDDLRITLERLPPYGYLTGFGSAKKEDTTNPKDLIGAKKPSLSNIPASALIYQAQAHKYGHEKYGYYNWREKKVQMMIYLDAILRHTLSIIDGEDNDDDSKLNHLAHIAANANILLDAKEVGNLIDDRPPEGVAAEVLARFTAC